MRLSGWRTIRRPSKHEAVGHLMTSGSGYIVCEPLCSRSCGLSAPHELDSTVRGATDIHDLAESCSFRSKTLVCANNDGRSCLLCGRPRFDTGEAVPLIMSR